MDLAKSARISGSRAGHLACLISWRDEGTTDPEVMTLRSQGATNRPAVSEGRGFSQVDRRAGPCLFACHEHLGAARPARPATAGIVGACKIEPQLNTPPGSANALRVWSDHRPAEPDPADTGVGSRPTVDSTPSRSHPGRRSSFRCEESRSPCQSITLRLGSLVAIVGLVAGACSIGATPLPTIGPCLRAAPTRQSRRWCQPALRPAPPLAPPLPRRCPRPRP